MSARFETTVCAEDIHPFALSGATEHYAADRPVHVEHIRIEVDLDFKEREIAGTCSSQVKAIREIRSLSFDAVDLDVRQVKVDGKSTPFSNSGQKLHVSLP